MALLGPPQPGAVLPQLDLRTKVQTPAAVRAPDPGPLQRRVGGGAARARLHGACLQVLAIEGEALELVVLREFAAVSLRVLQGLGFRLTGG